MKSFGTYSKYYDLFYQDKDYSAEAAYVLDLATAHGRLPSSILDLGCGTARHAIQWAALGKQVVGIEQSSSMVESALLNLASVGAQAPGSVQIEVGDARNVKLGRSFDLVVSMFHVLSYQHTNSDLQMFLTNARAHLDCAGIVIMDAWFGPAVLSSLPGKRVKTLKNGEERITRVAEPHLRFRENLVDVDYRIKVLNERANLCKEFFETHTMRYFFIPEIELLFAQAGLRLIACYEWMKTVEPSLNSWNVVFVGEWIEPPPL